MAGFRLACNAERWIEVKRQATTARSFGLEMHLLSPAEARDLWPPMTVDDVVGAAFLPTDGQANPGDIVQALARGARTSGVTVHEDIEVIGIRVENGAVRGIETDRGAISCEKLVLCAGQWTRDLGRLAGVNVPLVSVQHQYLITTPIESVTRGLPTLRDPDRLTYYKEEVGGLVMGGYEPNPIPWATNGLPSDFQFTLLDSDWDHFTPIMQQALERVPALATAGVKQLVNGPESFTPDGNFILGQAPEVRMSLSARVSMRLASRPAAAPAWRSPSGWRRASRRTTCGPWISAALAATTRTSTGCVPARWRPMASITRWRGLPRSTRQDGHSGSRRFMSA